MPVAQGRHPHARRSRLQGEDRPGAVGLHSKLLLTRDLFVSGSFNWLSARRDDSKANHELSQVLRGELADQEAMKQFRGMMVRTVEVEKVG
jgi:hypothetical protein